MRQPQQLVFARENEDLGCLYETYLLKQDTFLHGMGYVMRAPVKSTEMNEFTVVKTKPSDWRV